MHSLHEARQILNSTRSLVHRWALPAGSAVTRCKVIWDVINNVYADVPTLILGLLCPDTQYRSWLFRDFMRTLKSYEYARLSQSCWLYELSRSSSHIPPFHKAQPLESLIFAGRYHEAGAPTIRSCWTKYKHRNCKRLVWVVQFTTGQRSSATWIDYRFARETGPFQWVAPP